LARGTTVLLDRHTNQQSNAAKLTITSAPESIGAHPADHSARIVAMVEMRAHRRQEATATSVPATIARSRLHSANIATATSSTSGRLSGATSWALAEETVCMVSS
jgi:hypothetical protein